MQTMTPLESDFLIRRLRWPTERVDLVLDTDTYNEIDDQFALVYAILSAERLHLQAVYAAPFHNDRSSGPGDGMVKSYEEILRVLDALGRASDGFVFRGSEAWLSDSGTSVPSAARDDLVKRAERRPDTSPLYVVAIGAPTNVASAILAAPHIREKVVVLWLGGHPVDWHTAGEFNLKQDPPASRVLLDSGVPLVRFPCRRVAEMLLTTQAEIDAHLAGKSPVGDYLARIFGEFRGGALRGVGVSKVIWDLAALAWLVNQDWVATTLEPSPILTEGLTWSRDARRHPTRVAQHVNRDGVFSDLFARASAS